MAPKSALRPLLRTLQSPTRAYMSTARPAAPAPTPTQTPLPPLPRFIKDMATRFDARKMPPVHMNRDKVAARLAYVIPQARKIVTQEPVIPELDAFVRAAAATRLPENKAKVYRDCAVGLVEAFKTAPDNWDWLWDWAKRNKYSGATVHQAAIVYHSALASDYCPPAAMTLVLMLFYTAGYSLRHTPAVLSLAHLLLLSGSHMSQVQLFPNAMSNYADLIRRTDPNALTIEAKFLFLQDASGPRATAAAAMLAKALTVPDFEWRPMALVFLARYLRTVDQMAVAQALLECATQQYDFAVAWDELRDLERAEDSASPPAIDLALAGSSAGLKQLTEVFLVAMNTAQTKKEQGFYDALTSGLLRARELI